MKTIILHIGMPKTGTTALQGFLHQHELRDVLYPRTGIYPGRKKAPAHHELFYALVEDRSTVSTPWPAPRGTFNEILSDLLEEIEGSDKTTVILSSEILWNRDAIDRRALERIKEGFAGYRIRIEGFTRDPVGHAYSSYAQRVVGSQRYQGTLAEHVDDQLQDGTWSYDERSALYETVFGSESVRIHRYEDHAHNIIEAILRPLEEGSQSEVPKSNASRPWVSVRLTRRANIAGRRSLTGAVFLSFAKVLWLPGVRRLAQAMDAFAKPALPAPLATREGCEA